MEYKDTELYDAVVVGGGPAGLTAALYLARARYRVVVVEAENFGGQITITSEVVNYPGVASTNGKELTETMRAQAESFGAEFLSAKAESFITDGDVKTVKTDKGDLHCYAILLATGAHPRVIGFEGEREFRGRGVAYCATCDGEFFTGKPVFVIGGGFAAAEESVFLTKYASHVTVLIRGDDFTCAKSTADATRQNEKITVITNTEVESVSGGDFLQKIVYRNNKTGEVTEYTAPEGETFGVFVFAGYEPATSLVEGLAELDRGYVVTNAELETNVPGVFAAGDVCIKPLRQVVTAVGDGALAATGMEHYAAAMQKKVGIVPKVPEKAVPASMEDEEKEAAPAGESALFSADMLAQLNAVFSKMGSSLVLKVYTDGTPLAEELMMYMEELSKLTEKLTVEEITGSDEEYMPCVKVYREDGTWAGLAFHGVPGGHEFTSFVLGLYNAAGPGQALDSSVKQAAGAIEQKVEMKILVSLSCTMCPDLVTAAQRIACENENITAEVFDINHYGDLKDKYRVMSVPCLVINGDHVSFGKKNASQLMEIIEAALQ